MLSLHDRWGFWICNCPVVPGVIPVWESFQFRLRVQIATAPLNYQNGSPAERHICSRLSCLLQLDGTFRIPHSLLHHRHFNSAPHQFLCALCNKEVTFVEMNFWNFANNKMLKLKHVCRKSKRRQEGRWTLRSGTERIPKVSMCTVFASVIRVLWIYPFCQALFSCEWTTVAWKQEQRAAVKMSTGHWQLTWPLPFSFCDISTTLNKVICDLWNRITCYDYMYKFMCARESTASTTASQQDSCGFHSQPKLFNYDALQRACVRVCVWEGVHACV